MLIAEPVSTITRQRIFISRGSVPAVEPCLIPILGVVLLADKLHKILGVANVGHRVWSNVLRVELEASKHITEIF